MELSVPMQVQYKRYPMIMPAVIVSAWPMSIWKAISSTSISLEDRTKLLTEYAAVRKTRLSVSTADWVVNLRQKRKKSECLP